MNYIRLNNSGPVAPFKCLFYGINIHSLVNNQSVVVKIYDDPAGPTTDRDMFTVYLEPPMRSKTEILPYPVTLKRGMYCQVIGNAIVTVFYY